MADNESQAAHAQERRAPDPELALRSSLDYSRTPLSSLRVQRECYSLAHEDHFLGHYSTR